MHNIFTISVVGGSDGEDKFSPENDITIYDGLLHQWEMTARKQDIIFLFNLVKRGKWGQLCYLCDKDSATEAGE